MRTIEDAADIVGLSRRMIQEYEKSGIAIKPSKTNKYGYWDYDDVSLNRLWQIRVYKELGLKPCEMKAIFNDPDYDQVAALEEQVELLEKEKQKIDNLIRIVTFMKETGLTPEALYPKVATDSGVTFSDSFGMLGAVSKYVNLAEENPEPNLSDEEATQLFGALERVLTLYKDGEAFDGEFVQKAVQEFHQTVSPMLSESVLVLSVVANLFSPGSSCAKEIEKECEAPGAAEFFRKAVQKYCDNNCDTGLDKALDEAVDEILSLGKQKYKPRSDEVQTVVTKVYKLFETGFNTAIITPKSMMEYLCQLYADPDYYVVFDKIVHGRGAGKYIAAAFRYYCQQIDNTEQ